MSLSSCTCAFMESFWESATFILYMWTAVMFGVFIGWTWRPKWISSLLQAIRSTPCEIWTGSPGLAIQKTLRNLDNNGIHSAPAKACCACSSLAAVPTTQSSDGRCSLERVKQRSLVPQNRASSAVGEGDLLELYTRVHGREGGLSWDLMMERTAPGISYQAWRRDPQDGPTEYKSRTVFEDSTPELVKDFYWDDEFRSFWDDMLIYSKSMEACMDTGAEIVHWVRKFPFFCSDREYLIGRRIFEVEGIFYCITKAVPYAAVPRREKPLRVDVYYSSWCIRAAESSKKKGQWTACEVLFFHAEDMHIPKKIAKIGVRQGMWGCVRKMEPGLRKYEAHRSSVKSLSHSAHMAQLHTRMPPTFFDSFSPISLKESFSSLSTEDSSHDYLMNQVDEATRPCEVAIENYSTPGGGWKWLVVGGAILLACTLDRGILGRTVAFGLARRFGRVNQSLR